MWFLERETPLTPCLISLSEPHNVAAFSMSRSALLSVCCYGAAMSHTTAISAPVGLTPFRQRLHMVDPLQ